LIMMVWAPKGNIKVRMRWGQEPRIIQPADHEVFEILTAWNRQVTSTTDFSFQGQEAYP
jgi:hypothetical protein